MKNKLKNELEAILKILIRKGISVNQNFPKIKDNEVKWSGNDDISISLKSIDYREIYERLDNDKIYFTKLIDGALIQISYEVKKKDILKARLAYYPSPLLKRYEEESEEYISYSYGEGVYNDILSDYRVTFPIRIDYDPKSYIEKEHPKSHLHFGQIENCRIPMSKILSPKNFFEFILRNFYNEIFKDIGEAFFSSQIQFENLLTENEKKMLHINGN